MSVKFKGNGYFSKLKNYLEKIRRRSKLGEEAQDFASSCIKDLKKVTPKDSGLTAESWDYEININGKTTSITFINKNVQNGYNVALLIEFGHGTPEGVWIEGQEYIDPVIRQHYVDLITRKWKELKKS